MSVNKLKRRYAVSMTKTVVDRFQLLAKSLALSPWIMSTICETALESASEMFQKAKDEGAFPISSLVHFIGEQVEAIEKDDSSKLRGEVKKIAKSTQKAKGVEKGNGRVNRRSVR